MSAPGRSNVALGALFLLLVAAHWAVPSDPTVRNFHFVPNMVNAVSLEAQGPPPMLADGTALDPRPPVGSVARGYRPLPFAAGPEEAARAGMELHSPLAADDPEALARGQVVFESWCATCHGVGGLGDGPVTRRGVPPPPSLLAEHAVGLADGQIFHVITFGQGNMASYASQVERDDRWNAVVYIRSLQGAR